MFEKNKNVRKKRPEFDPLPETSVQKQFKEECSQVSKTRINLDNKVAIV